MPQRVVISTQRLGRQRRSWRCSGQSGHGPGRSPPNQARIDKDKYLGVVEAEGDAEAVEAAIEKFRVPASERHMIMVSKVDTKSE
jgi:hypothetical protein